VRLRLFMPGRLCMVGEHSDWAGGYRRDDPSVETGMCMITGTDQGLYGTASPAEGAFELRQVTETGDPGRMTVYPSDPGSLREVAESEVFDSYAAGVASLITERFGELGLRLDVHRRTLPMKRGLSSSAAICLLTARAFNRIHQLDLSIEDEMELAYQGEIMTGSSCGRMDQACVYGNVPVVLTFDGDSMTTRKLSPGAELHFLIVDLLREKDTRRILADLNAAFARGDPGIRHALGEANHRILTAASAAVEEGDAEALGALMTEAQSIFDSRIAPACPSELASPRLHAVLAHPAADNLTWGGKGVGSQGDGTAQFICRGADARKDLADLLEQDLEVACLELTIPAAGWDG
jgi:galactokinase